MPKRSPSEVRRLQRARRRARRLAANLCLHGLCCPNAANTEAEVSRSATSARWLNTVHPESVEASLPLPLPHTLCPTHRTRAGRRAKRAQA